MKEDLLNFLVSPKSKSKLKLSNNEKNGSNTTLVDSEGNEFPIINNIPRFVSQIEKTPTNQSFSYKWNTFNDAALSKQESNKKLFLEHYNFTNESFKQYLSQKSTILDIGCGIGYISNWIASEFHKTVFGVDLTNSVDVGEKYFSENENNPNFIQADVGELPFENHTLDMIIAKEMIHHTPEPRKNFSKLVNLLKPGGSILIYVYNKKGPIREFCDDYIRKFTTKLSEEDCHKFSKIMTKLGKSLREQKITITIPEDIPYLDISKGNYDLQRFIYWNFFKCWWDDNGNVEYSDAVNFDWYHPPDAFRYSENEFKKWFSEEELVIESFNSLESGYAVRAVKPNRS